MTSAEPPKKSPAGPHRHRQFLFALLLCYHSFLFSISAPSAYAQLAASEAVPGVIGVSGNVTFDDLRPCQLTSSTIARLGPGDYLHPCIIADVMPGQGGGGNVGNVGDGAASAAFSGSAAPPPSSVSANRSAVVTVVMVTPHFCEDFRDGAATGVESMNRDNGGLGIRIGFHEDFYVRFRLVSVVAGNSRNLGTERYNRIHADVLDSMLETLRPRYIVGTCSHNAAVEKELALRHETILMAQVGPPSFYDDTGGRNPYVFGMHINSDLYTFPALQQLYFHALGGDHPTDGAGPEAQPVRVVYRTKSEFFNSTCRAVIDTAARLGFVDVEAIAYDPDGDADGDGVANDIDDDFLRDVGDRACPPGSGEGGHFHPALFVCTLTEQDVLLERWRENGCRPAMMWMTAATWGWANDHVDVVPYVTGGGQWHPSFDYRDEYFESGEAVLEYNHERLGYLGTYDMVVSYAIPILFARHIASFYLTEDDPDLDFDFENRYEDLRRHLLILKAETVFGPFALDRSQRNQNIGRSAAGTQWVPESTGNNSSGTVSYRNACVSPMTQAEVDTVMPSLSAVHCEAGEFTSSELVRDGPCLLCDKCDGCPVDSFTLESNEQLVCFACPEGSTTNGEIGSTFCIQYDANLLSDGLLAMGYTFVAINWALALGFICWIIHNREDPVVKIGQPQFLILICVGAIISTSAIIAISMVQTGVGEDTSSATAACRAIPYLYLSGWVIEYGSLSAKSYRLYKMLNCGMRRVKITARDMYKIVVIPLLLNLIIVTIWTFVDPLEYGRRVTGTYTNSNTGVVTIESMGSCLNGSSINIWAFVAPLMALFIGLMVATNALLYQVRNFGERYQEQKYVTIASVYSGEILLLGLLIMIAVRDSAEATYIALVGINFSNNFGILCFIFIPKINYKRRGLPPGVSVMQSLVQSNNITASNVKAASSTLSAKLPGIGENSAGAEQVRAEDETGEGIEKGVSAADVGISVATTECDSAAMMLDGSHLAEETSIVPMQDCRGLGTKDECQSGTGEVSVDSHAINAIGTSSTPERQSFANNSDVNPATATAFDAMRVQPTVAHSKGGDGSEVSVTKQSGDANDHLIAVECDGTFAPKLLGETVCVAEYEPSTATPCAGLSQQCSHREGKFTDDGSQAEASAVEYGGETSPTKQDDMATAVIADHH